jgi:hypothetical protein
MRIRTFSFVKGAPDLKSKTRPQGSGRIRDGAFLFALVLISTVPYLNGLGFYSDDWGYTALLSQCTKQSVGGLCGCLWQEEAAFRPLQSLELAALYKAFGLHPLGYHVVNSVIFGGVVVLFYWVLREVGFRRLISVAVPSVYAFLPHYSTDRFWISAAQVNLSMALCLLCFYSAAKASSVPTPRKWRPLCVCVLSMAGSIFSYEIGAALFVLIPILLYVRLSRLRNQMPKEASSRHDPFRIAVLTLIAVIVTMGIKYSVQTRVQFSSRLHLLTHFGAVMLKALSRFVNFNYGIFSFGLPRLAWRSMHERWDPLVLFIGTVAWIAIALYCWTLSRRDAQDSRLRRDCVALILAGTVVYWLGYAPFLTAKMTASPFAMTITGVENRLMIAMTCGTAMAVAGVFGMAVSFLSKDWLRNGLLSLGVGFLCACGLVVIATEASYWRAASQKQRDVLADIRNHFPVLPHGTILLLDGICPYIGPGIVFETHWDTSGALQILYGDPTLAGDVISSKVSVLPNRLVTSIYGEETSYPYNRNLLTYHLGRHRECPLEDSRAAQACLDSGNWRHTSCPAGSEGVGVPIF